MARCSGQAEIQNVSRADPKVDADKNLRTAAEPAFLQLEEGHCAREILTGINKLRKQNSTLCDMSVLVGPKSFLAHRVVLAAFSPFFARRISYDTRGYCCMTVNGMKPEIFETILNYAYSFSIKITTANAQAILRAARQLEIAELSLACVNVLGKNVDSSSFIELNELASDISCSVLAGYVRNYILRNFAQLSLEETFLELPHSYFKSIIASDELEVSNEEIVFKAVMRWTHHKEERKTLLPPVRSFTKTILKLLLNIRLPLLSPEFLNKIQEDESIRASTECMYWISKALMLKLHPEPWTQVEPLSALLLSSTQRKPATAPDVEVLVIYGKNIPFSEESPEEIYALNITNGKSRKLQCLPDSPSCQIRSIAVAGNSLYAIAEFPSTDQKDGKVLGSISRYDASADSWSKITSCDSVGPLTEGFVVLDSSMFVFVRVDCDAAGSYRWFERLDLENLTSTGVASVTDAALTTTLLPVEDKIYAFSGPSSLGGLVDTIQRYDPTSNTWIKLEPMLSPCGKVMCCLFKGKIYVFDGERGNSLATIMKPQIYEVSSNKWDWGPPLNKAYFHPVALIVINNRLIFIDKTRFPSLDIEQFCPEKNAWEIYSKQIRVDIYARKEIEICCGTLKIKSF